MVYCLQADRVLLMLRRKAPNLGLWVGPGGKLEAGESPYECARRELHEETGLQAHRLLFRGMVTEVSPRPDWQWLLFLYVAPEFSGELISDEREGVCRWWPLAEVPQLPLPQADRLFFPQITNLERPFYQAKFEYDAQLNVVGVSEQPG